MALKSNEPLSGGKLTPVLDLYDPMVIDLYEVHDRLWYEYFCPKEPHNKKMKLFMQDQLNAVGEEINKTAKAMKTPQQKVEIVTSNKQFDMDEHGPELKRPIYVETQEPIKKKGAGKAKKNGVIKEDEEDLMGEDYKEDKRNADKAKARKYETNDDDDLLGEDPKKKSAPKKEGGKSNYDKIAELAAKGKNRDQIVELTGLARKTVTDNLWRYNKNKTSKK